MTGNEPVGLSMSLDSLIQKAGGRGSGGSDRGRGRGRGSFAGGVRGGGVSKPEGGSFNRDRQPARHNFSDARGGFGRGGRGSSIQDNRGVHAGGRAPGVRGTGNAGSFGGMQRQQPNAMAQRPVGFVGTRPAAGKDAELAAAQARLQEQERIIMQQQMQVQQLLQQQQMIQQGLVQQQLLQQTVAQQPSGTLFQRPGGPSLNSSMPSQKRGREQPARVEEPEEPEVLCECFLDDDTNVVVQLEGIPIVTVSASGEVMLSTGGWWTADTVAGMNQALKVINMKVMADGDPEEGNWTVSDGHKLLRFQDEMRIPPKGHQAAYRAGAILSWFQDPKGPSRAGPATGVYNAGMGMGGGAGALPGRLSGRMGSGAAMGRSQMGDRVEAPEMAMARRLQAQGRF